MLDCLQVKIPIVEFCHLKEGLSQACWKVSLPINQNRISWKPAPGESISRETEDATALPINQNRISWKLAQFGNPFQGILLAFLFTD